jgi:superfamily II DNA or RNA helicase
MKLIEEKLAPLIELTKRQDIGAIRTQIESMEIHDKGLLFELYLKKLFEGNGWLAENVGRRGETSADILLYHPSTPDQVQLVVQAKNWKRPLTWDDAIKELKKFEILGQKKYNCSHFWVVSVSGFVETALQLRQFNLDLKNWNFVEELIREFNPEKTTVPKLTLYPHNEEAYASIIKAWETKKKVAIVQATGTGKSFLIAKVFLRDLKTKKLFLAPQEFILGQQRRRVPWANDNVEYCNYQGFSNFPSEKIQEIKPEIIVLDEFHRCGAPEWGKGIQRLLNLFPNAYVLGTSATPIRYLDQNRNMVDELFEGNVPINLSLADRIKKKILPAPKYISSLYQIDEDTARIIDEVKKSNRKEQEKQKLLQKIEDAKIEWKRSAGVPAILRKHFPDSASKVIVFCDDNEHLNLLRPLFLQWFQEADIQKHQNQYVVTIRNTAYEEEFRRFKETKAKKGQLHILFAVDMLNEGLHLGDVRAVFLMRRTESPRLFYQQIGRCIQAGTKDSPVIFDMVNNFRSIRAGNFKKDLEDAERKHNDRRFSFGLPMMHVPVQIIDEAKDIIQIFEDIELRLDNWDYLFDKLCEFIKIHGHTFVSYQYPDAHQLANWVHRQRTYLRKRELSEERKKKLNTIGFSWDPTEAKWMLMFEKMNEYYKTHGTCTVPRKYPPDKPFARWVNYQQFRKTRLRSFEREKLDSINFFDRESVQIITFDLGLNFLDEYIKIKGNANVSQIGENRKLGRWVNTLRQKKKQGKLTEEQITQLEARGFLWEAKDTINEARWDKRLAELKAYKEETGSFQIPNRYPQNSKLANWFGKLMRQRPTPARLNKLLAIGFDWEAEVGKRN